jgi:hypothetical protein
MNHISHPRSCNLQGTKRQFPSPDTSRPHIADSRCYTHQPRRRHHCSCSARCSLGDMTPHFPSTDTSRPRIVDSHWRTHQPRHTRRRSCSARCSLGDMTPRSPSTDTSRPRTNSDSLGGKTAATRCPCSGRPRKRGNPLGSSGRSRCGRRHHHHSSRNPGGKWRASLPRGSAHHRRTRNPADKMRYFPWASRSRPHSPGSLGGRRHSGRRCRCTDNRPGNCRSFHRARTRRCHTRDCE